MAFTDYFSVQTLRWEKEERKRERKSGMKKEGRKMMVLTEGGGCTERERDRERVRKTDSEGRRTPNVK